MNFQTLKVVIHEHIAWLKLDRPNKANAMNLAMWDELPKAAAWLDEQPGVRVVILCGEGKHFTAGIDLEVLGHLSQMVNKKGCAARARENLHTFIRKAQDSFSAFEKLRMPVIAAVHGACIGAGVDLIAACDLRYCSADAQFSIKEVDLAVTADVGTLQRLRHVIGLPRLTELTYTAESFSGAKAEAIGLVGRAYGTREELMAEAEKLARNIAAKSPITVRGIKRNLLWSRDHSVQDGLEYIAAWNAGMLVSDDATEAMMAVLQKREAKFAD